MVSDALDGKIQEYHIKKAELGECLEEVKELKQRGLLNPVIVSTKPKTNKIDDFFKKQKEVNDFVKKKSKNKLTSKDCEAEEIEESS